MASVNELNRVLTIKGYAIKKSVLSEKQQTDLRSSLTVAPKVLEKFQKCAVHFPIYGESKTRFYVPRHWGIKKYGEPEANIIPMGKEFLSSMEWNSEFTPHDFQKEIMQQFIDRGANGLICVPCGYGKTFMALRIAITIGYRFLIIVDKEFLMNQWKAEIERFIKGARVGILQADTIQTDSDKYDITIGMIQTICKREFPDSFFDEYGFTIFDECHHLGASYFCKALKQIQTRYMLGLSATPDREDGLTFVFESYLGDAVYKKTQRDPDREALVRAIWFHSDDPEYHDIPINGRGEPITAKLLNQVADYEARNERIMTIIREYAKDNRRYLLLLSDRISQLEWFYERISDNPEWLQMGFRIGYYIGGMKQVVLDENAATCQLLLATYQMASEAFSVKRLNTVILATPRKNVQQSTGRIFRERMDERKVPPHIVDIIDSHDCHKRRWYVRQKFYKECEYTIQHTDKPKRVVEKAESNEHGCFIKF